VESPDDDTRLLTLRGELDVATVPRFRAALDEALAEGVSGIVVDLREVTFIDSTGVATLLNALRRVVRGEGRLALACNNPTVLRVFQVTRTDSTFAIFPTREQALAHARASPPIA
jgi:anti-sigma B factor antagonist